MRVRETEQLALTLLKKHFPEYSGLTLSDKPDLIDPQKSIGVEVTRALNPKVEQRLRHVEEKMKNRDITEFSDEQIKKVEQFGLHIVCKEQPEEEKDKIVGMIRVFGLEENEQLYIAIRKKYSKQYTKLKRLDLYVYFRHICEGSWGTAEKEKVFSTAYECQKQHGEVFENIMIDFYSVLLIFDLKKHEIKEIPYEVYE